MVTDPIKAAIAAADKSKPDWADDFRVPAHVRGRFRFAQDPTPDQRELVRLLGHHAAFALGIPFEGEVAYRGGEVKSKRFEPLQVKEEWGFEESVWQQFCHIYEQTPDRRRSSLRSGVKRIAVACTALPCRCRTGRRYPSADGLDTTSGARSTGFRLSSSLTRVRLSCGLDGPRRNVWCKGLENLLG